MISTRIRIPILKSLLAVALASPMAVAGPVSSTTNPQAKIEEIEKAGAALMKGQVDEAYRLLQEASKKNPSLRPPRLMLALLFLNSNSRDGVVQGRNLLEHAFT